MISNRTIDLIDNLDIVDVVSHFIDLDKHHKASCPFHNEKTSSFSVHPGKNIFKCFGCGVGGGSVKFVMEHEGITSFEAIQLICEKFDIELEFTNEDTKKRKQQIDEKKKLLGILKRAQDLFHERKSLKPAQEFFKLRGYDEDIVNEFELGYSGDDFNFIKKRLLPKGLFPDGEKVGLVKSRDGRNYDVLNERITFPIHTQLGEVCGFGARIIKKEKGAKYLNSPSSPVYNKSKILYNLHRAIPYIRESGTAFLVEGYTDVIALWKAGIMNVVASCGTAFTPEQAKILHRFAKNIVIFYDGDKAGLKATQQSGEICIQYGLRVAVCNFIGFDPEEYLNQLEPSELDQIQDHLISNQVHFIEWLIDIKLTDNHLYRFRTDVATETFDYFKTHCSITGSKNLIRATSPKYLPIGEEFDDVSYSVSPLKIYQKEDGIKEVLRVLKHLSEVAQEEFLTKINELTRAKTTTLKKMMKSEGGSIYSTETEQTDNSKSVLSSIPDDCDKDFLMKYGFAPINDNSGYYFLDKKGFDKVANFVIEPLFHLKGEESKRYVRLLQRDQSHLLVLDSVAFGGPDTFGNALYRLGEFVFANGNKQRLDRLKTFWGDQFPPCYELNRLGWQPEGFFAFSNVVYNGKLSKYSDLGIYTHQISEKVSKNFLSPSLVEDMQDHRAVEDPYENDKYLTYCKSPISFSKWMALFNEVYRDHAPYGIAFVFMTIFRDIAERRGQIPLLYVHGKTSAGKSQFLDSILHLFFSGKDGSNRLMKPFAIDQGTDFAFFNVLDRFFNCPVFFDEFDAGSIDDTRFQAIKGSYDGSGRTKGSGKGNKTITQKVNSTLMLAGQFLNASDDGSVVNRSIVRNFTKQDYTQADIDNFHELKSLEKKGLSSLITDILKHRKEVNNLFDNRFGVLLAEWRKHFRNSGILINNRLIQNYVKLYTFMDIFMNQSWFDFPFTLDHIRSTFMNDLQEANKIVSQTDGVAQFWDYVAVMIDNGALDYGYDIDIVTVQDVDIRIDGNNETIYFDVPKTLVYLQMNNVGIAYTAEVRKVTGKPGIEKGNLERYLKESESYIGLKPIHTFSSHRNPTKTTKRTSCHVFDTTLIASTLHPRDYTAKPKTLNEKKAEADQIEEQKEQLKDNWPF